MGVIKNRYDFVFLFDVVRGTVNGDPNNPYNSNRIDEETGHGIVSDVCIKRMDREFNIAKGRPVFVDLDKPLNYKFEDIIGSDEEEIRKKAVDHFIDIKRYGGVLSTKLILSKNGKKEESKNGLGSIHNTIHISSARSIDPVHIENMKITRKAQTKEEKNGSGTFGDKSYIDYGLFMGTGRINAMYADKNNFTEDDLKEFWDDFVMMFDYRRTATSGVIGLRKLIAFRHDSKLGNASDTSLFELVNVTSNSKYPRSFSDYSVSLNETTPSGVELIEIV